MKYEIERLKNGLEVIFVDVPGNTSASVQIWFRAGSTLEDKSNFGIAHFLEHMFFKGTKKRPGAKIAHDVESYGGEINAFTSFDYTCYYINSPIAYFNNSIDIVMDMVSNPMFKEEDLIPEREVVFEEYRRSQDNPGQFSFQRIQEMSFKGGYAHPILGNENTIKNFTREQLTEFRNSHYNNANAFLVVAGDLSEKEKYKKTIESYHLPEGSFSERPSFSLQKKSTIEIHKKDVRMCQLTMAIECPPMKSNGAAAEDLAYNALGYGETSPLYKNLVLRNTLANNCTSSSMFFADGGIHFLRINFPKENYQKVMSELEKTISEVSTVGLKESDIKKIKNQYVAAKIYEKESLESYAFSLGSSYAGAKDLDVEQEFIDKIRKISLKEVNKKYSEIFGRSIHLSLQLPNDLKPQEFKPRLTEFKKKLAQIKKTGKDNTIKSTKSKYDPATQVIEVKPGIKLLYRYNSITPTFVMHAYLKGGLVDETLKTNGLYSLMSSQLTKGYKGLSYEKLKLDLDSRSTMFNSFSGKNAYGITMHGQIEHFSDLSKHFFKSLITPSFQSKSLNHEKKLILRTIEANKADPTRQCFTEATNILFKGHPYSLSTIGNEKSIRSIKKDDLIKKHEKNLKSKEMLITFCGDLSVEEVLEKVEFYFSDLKPRKEKKKEIKKIEKIKTLNKHIDFDREQTQILIATQTKKLTAKENVVFKMLTTHLSGQSSELFVDVRDRKGLCYVAQPIHMNALEAGYWGIYMASGHDKTLEAIDAINSILAKIQREGLSKSNFNRIKKMIEGQNQLNLQVNDDYANVYSVPTLHGLGSDYFYKANKEISDFKHEDFQRIVKKVLSQNWITITVGKPLDKEMSPKIRL
ncbi:MULTISPECIES: M16 family metallopeptidase [unclassified Halobacteriovorax]|uniref:M16 family metallopeptidase n=1 Tax=unclassified Halobacteriovorax TaxID=2639665 RepID=UPI000EA121CF|nr:pitrilysin family protein [Halobacteriovorax sp. BALOs_7]AYF45856.1 peptidase, M16 family [Halobacteriovorax sp. BALOs_7]